MDSEMNANSEMNAPVGYEMIKANSALRASLAIYHFIPNRCEWNNCFIKNASKI